MTLVSAALGAILGACLMYAGGRRMRWLGVGLASAVVLTAVLLSAPFFESRDAGNVVTFGLTFALGAIAANAFVSYGRRHRQADGSGSSPPGAMPRVPAPPTDDTPTWR